MLNFWDNTNKVTTRGLQVQTLVAHNGRSGIYEGYVGHRIATKSYSYICMTEAAARACQAAKLAQYTRRFVISYNENMAYKPTWEERCVASVKLECDDGGMWSVNIDVNEDQEQRSPYYNHVYSLFDTTLDYDEDDPEGVYLRISSAYRENSAFKIAYEQSGIKNFARANLVVEVSSDKVTWTTATPSAHTDGLITFNAQAWQNKYHRIRYGEIAVSNVCAPPDIDRTRALTLSGDGPGQQTNDWVVGYTQDFANFNREAMLVHSRQYGGNWADVAAGNCLVTGSDVRLMNYSLDTLFQVRVRYDGVDSNIVNNLYALAPIIEATKSDEITGTSIILKVSCGLGLAFLDGYASIGVSADGTTWERLNNPTVVEDGDYLQITDMTESAVTHVRLFYGEWASGQVWAF